MITSIGCFEEEISRRLGKGWTATGVTDLHDLASHPCAVVHGSDGFDVFVKRVGVPEAVAEVKGLNLIRRLAGVRTPMPVGDGIAHLDDGCLLLFEALVEVPGKSWRRFGRALATLHLVSGQRFGLDEFDGFFGPLPQDNRTVEPDTWAEFYARRRLEPLLRSAVDSGHLPGTLKTGVERLIGRLDGLVGPRQGPALVHGDAQQNNFLSLASGEVAFIDAAPYFGHPEVDLALIDYFAPVPVAVFDGYREVRPIDEGFEERRELWRLHGYLAVVAVDGASEFGRPFLDRIAQALARYR